MGLPWLPPAPQLFESSNTLIIVSAWARARYWLGRAGGKAASRNSVFVSSAAYGAPCIDYSISYHLR